MLQHKRQLHFNARRNEIFDGYAQHFSRHTGVAHVLEQSAEIRLINLAGLLHSAAGQANFVAYHLVAFGEFERHPCAVDTVAILNGHSRKTFGEMFDLHARFFCVIQLCSELCDDFSAQHIQALLNKGWRLLCLPS